MNGRLEMFGIDGLHPNDTRLTKDKKKGILRRVEGDKYEEVLECVYDEIGDF